MKVYVDAPLANKLMTGVLFAETAMSMWVFRDYVTTLGALIMATAALTQVSAARARRRKPLSTVV